MSHKTNSKINLVGYYTDKYASNDDTACHKNIAFSDERHISDGVTVGVLKDDLTKSQRELTNPTDGLYNGDVFPLTENALNKENGIDNNISDVGTLQAKKVFNYKLAKTFLLIGSWIVNGLMVSIMLPTIPDLQERVNANIEELTGTTSMRNVGWIMGSLVGGILFDRFRKTWDLQLSIGFFVESFSVAFKPWCRSIGTLAFLSWMEGMSHGLYGLVGNGMMIAIWGSNSPSPLQAMHVGFKIGATVAPLIAYPFLSGTRGGSMPDNLTLSINATGTGTEFDSNIEVPYFIVGGLAILTSLVYLAFYLAPRPDGLTYTNLAKGRSLKALLHPGSFTNGNVKFGVLLMTCMFLYNAFNGTTATQFHLLQASIATETLNASKQEASLVQSAARASQIAGQLIFVPIAKFTPMPILMFLITHAIAVINIVAAIYGLKSLLSFGIFGCIFDFFFSSQYASSIAWAELYMDVTGSAIMVWNVGFGAGNALVSWASGYVLRNFGAPNVMLFNAVFAVGLCVLIYVTQGIMSYYGPKTRDNVPTK